MDFRAEKILAFIEIPKVHWNASLDKIPELRYKGKFLNYIKNIETRINDGRGMYLWGLYGRGKSAMAAICLKAAARHYQYGLWITAKTLPGLIIDKKMFDDNLTYYERALSVPLLVLDEFQIRANISFIEKVWKI